MLKNIVTQKQEWNKEKRLMETDKQLADATEEKSSRVNFKNNDSLFFHKKQTNAFNEKSETLKRKEADIVIEPRKPGYMNEPANISLQNKIATLAENNKMTIPQKLSVAIKARKPNVSKKPLFSATVFYSPDFVISKVDNNNHNFREDDRNEIKRKEKIKNAYSSGVLVSYNTGKNLSIQSGVTFSAMATDIQPKMIYAGPDNRGNVHYRFNCSAGYSYTLRPGGIPAAGDSIRALASKNILQYIGVPFAITYSLKKGKFNLHPGIGIAANFLKKQKIETVIAGMNGDEKAEINQINGLNTMYLNSAVSLGINYTINQNTAFSFTPAARLALTSINTNAPVKTYLNSYGLAAGLTLKLE